MRGWGEWCWSGWRGETSDDLPAARIGPAASLIPMYVSSAAGRICLVLPAWHFCASTHCVLYYDRVVHNYYIIVSILPMSIRAIPYNIYY